MPEGDTIFRTATVLRRALVGHPVTAFEPRDLAPFRPIVGRTVQAVEPRGKHLLILFRRDAKGPGDAPIRVPDSLSLHVLPSDLILHTHLRMTGSWHVYRPGEPWRKPARFCVAAVYTEQFVAPCFSAPTVELLSAREAARHPQLSTLGPDAITDGFDIGQAVQRIRLLGDAAIGIALMNQSAMAGVGNVFKSEALFIRRLSPFGKAGDLSQAELEGLIFECSRLLKLNRERSIRRTMYRLDNGQLLWVYGRAGRPCRICAEPVAVRRQGLEGRVTFYCPRCQRVPPFPAGGGG